MNGRFAVAVSEKQQQSGSFRIGHIVKGKAGTKKYPAWEFAGGTGALKPISKAAEGDRDD